MLSNLPLPPGFCLRLTSSGSVVTFVAPLLLYPAGFVIDQFRLVRIIIALMQS